MSGIGTRKLLRWGAAMIDHISIPVRDLRASTRFYEALLAPLGMTKVVNRPNTVGFGKTYPEFWLNERSKLVPQSDDAGAHIALRAANIEAVDAFHAAALAAGAHSDGAPGMRLEYSSHYYAAFVRDWDGNRVEAVTFLRDTK
jgi:catechol 2,3-dioxygenase-like lactoylglutathione lyase family enzyme